MSIYLFFLLENKNHNWILFLGQISSEASYYVDVHMPYSKYIQFGKALNPAVQNPDNASNPLTYCMYPSLSSQFIHGSTSGGQLYSNTNTACSQYMVERCSKKWDQYCDAFVELNPDSYWPNMGVVDKQAYENAKLFWNLQTSVGEDLIRNTMYARYILPRGTFVSKQPFDPNVANSPTITVYDTDMPYYSKVVGLDNPAQIRKDTYLPMMIRNAKLCWDVLARIFLGYIRREEGLQDTLRGTILESFFRENESVLREYIRQAVRFVPSFQIQNRPPYECVNK